MRRKRCDYDNYQINYQYNEIVLSKLLIKNV